MTQNIYDNSDFFREYSRMDRSLYGLAGAPEWRSLQLMLPDLQGARVLDLGCGFGWFSRWAREQGAQSVLGLDVSENMLVRAIEMTSDDAVVYRQLIWSKSSCRKRPSTWYSVLWSCTTSKTLTAFSSRFIAHWYPGDCSFFRPNIRSLPRHAARSGLFRRVDAALDPSINIWPRVLG